ncbi:MAG: FitA-like ribbon-helix-helix domain-containing protein [Syntrophobacteraceae bacterium]
MPTITIKNIPEDIYARIKESAFEHGRSINGEVIYLLKRACHGRRIDLELFLEKAEAIRNKFVVPPLTDQVLRDAKREGSP